MNEALFNPKFGYYTTKNPIGKKGDFITSPEISQVFGELIGVYLVNIWQNNYSSQKISLVEMGAGHGTLMKDLLNFTQKIPGFLQNCSLNIVEISPKLKEIQQQNLKNFNIKWWKNFTDFSKENQQPIFFIANELLDCFPINQYLKINNCWQEKLVGLNNEKLDFFLAKEDQKLNQILDQLTKNEAKNGAIFEHSPILENFLSELFFAIKQNNGIGILIDYGFEKNEFKNTLQAVKSHQFSNILENIGQSDLTSLVNFSHLKGLAKNQQLQNWVITQKEFLESLGIEIRRQKLLENKSDSEKKLIDSSINRLISENEMGELFKFFIFCN